MRDSVKRLIDTYLLSEERRTTIIKKFSRAPVSVSVPAHAHDASYYLKSQIASLFPSDQKTITVGSWAFPANWDYLPGLEITLAPVVDSVAFAMFWCTVDHRIGGAALTHAKVVITMDADLWWSAGNEVRFLKQLANPLYSSLVIQHLEAVSAGSHTFKVKGRYVTFGGCTVKSSQAELSVFTFPG